MQEQPALIIFTRNPELGKCKTRLAAHIGDEAALNVYKHLLNHTKSEAIKTQADRFVFYSEEIIADDIWNSEYFNKKLQIGDTLGERMHQAFVELFNLGYQKVCIIGSDLLDLRSEIIMEAFQKLEKNKVVIGPATDGGYYLLALKAVSTNIFYNKQWGSDSVLKDTLNDLKEDQVYLLKELNDIDTFEDMKHYQELKHFYD